MCVFRWILPFPNIKTTQHINTFWIEICVIVVSSSIINDNTKGCQVFLLLNRFVLLNSSVRLFRAFSRPYSKDVFSFLLDPLNMCPIVTWLQHNRPLRKMSNGTSATTVFECFCQEICSDVRHIGMWCKCLYALDYTDCDLGVFLIVPTKIEQNQLSLKSPTHWGRILTVHIFANWCWRLPRHVCYANVWQGSKINRIG